MGRLEGSGVQPLLTQNDSADDQETRLQLHPGGIPGLISLQRLSGYEEPGLSPSPLQAPLWMADTGT